MDHIKNMRKIINEVDGMSRRKFLRGIGSTAASAVINPQISIGSDSTAPVIENDAQKLAGFLVKFVKRHAENVGSHPEIGEMVDYSKSIVSKLKNGWKPREKDLAKIFLRQENAVETIYGSGAEDPELEWIWDQKEMFGYDNASLSRALDDTIDEVMQLARSTIDKKLEIPKRPPNTDDRKELQVFKDMLSSEEEEEEEVEISKVVEQMPPKLRDALDKKLDAEGKTIEDLTSEELLEFLENVKSDGSGIDWVYSPPDATEEITYNPAVRAYLDVENDYNLDDFGVSMPKTDFFEPLSDPGDDEEPEPKLEPKLEPKVDQDKDDEYGDEEDIYDKPDLNTDPNTDPKKEHFESSNYSIRHFINLVENFNKK